MNESDETKTTPFELGQWVRAALLSSKDLRAAVTEVFPIIADEGVLPYIAYRCESLSETGTKCRNLTRQRFELEIYTADYDESTRLASLAYDALTLWNGGGFYRAVCLNRRECWAGDAYCQSLIFELSTNPL